MYSPRFFISQDDAGIPEGQNSIRCGLCPGKCQIPPGGKGSCRVRMNLEGKPALPRYGFITALSNDPIEKKPLYHFRPATGILSAGFAGCNLHCPFCQNWHISQNTDVQGQFYSPADLIAGALKSGQSIAAIHSIAYTYSEPLVHIEYLLDCMTLARKSGVANVLVSNGCINSEAAEEVLELTDAANIDLKCFSKETYAKVLGGDLETVLNFIKTACRKGVHIELTTLVVPDLNDSREELEACADFIAELENSGSSIHGKQSVPWHLSAYHPDWKWKTRSTAPSFLSEAASMARQRLAHVYTGNLADEKNDTFCVHCGKILISRRGYRVDISGLSFKKEIGKPAYFCAHCGKQAPVRY